MAGEFLARFRSKEGQDGIEFQKDSEQYSPWKMMELEEESKAANENRPTSFAQAVRKQSMEKFSNAAGASNGEPWRVESCTAHTYACRSSKTKVGSPIRRN